MLIYFHKIHMSRQKLPPIVNHLSLYQGELSSRPLKFLFLLLVKYSILANKGHQ